MESAATLIHAPRTANEFYRRDRRQSMLAPASRRTYASGMDHHVYFWLNEESQAPAQREAFEQGLASLFEIPLVKGGRWTIPAKVMPRPVIDQSWDYALTMQFDSIEDQDAYQIDPTHHAFIDSNKHRWAKVLVMDLA